MPSQTHPFELSVYPGTDPGPVRRISGRIERQPDHLRIGYLLEGDLAQLRIPAPAAPRAADELWRHTCFELFVAATDGPGYFEFNFSPSGEWAVYGFSDYRRRLPDTAATAPQIMVRGSEATLELEAVVPFTALPRACGEGPLALALSAVIEPVAGALSYWALAHPGPKPDFHHPDAFVLRLHEIRN